MCGEERERARAFIPTVRKEFVPSFTEAIWNSLASHLVRAERDDLRHQREKKVEIKRIGNGKQEAVSLTELSAPSQKMY